MTITVLRQAEYKDTFIYIRNFGIVFEYLVSWDGEIYHDHILLKPRLWRRIAYYLRIVSLYNSQQIKDAEKIMLSGAVKTVDRLVKTGKTRAGKRRIEKAKAGKKKKKCLWQTRQVEVDYGDETKEEGFYLCLVHNKLVEMEDGVEPSHN